MDKSTHLLTLPDGSTHRVELDPYNQTEIWGLVQLSPTHSVACGELEDPESYRWYATPIGRLLLEQETLTLIAL